MKTESVRYFSGLASLLVASALGASASTEEIVVAVRGPHHRLWQRVEGETNYVLNEVVFHTNAAYVELETGMHFLDEKGQWSESRAEIELLEDGAAATNLPFQVYFAANLNATGKQGAVTLVTPDAKQLRSRILGLSFFDGTTGKAVLIAETTDSIGLLVGTDRVWYTNAFDDVDATVEYVITKAGLSQNIILKTQLPSPAEWGLNPETSRLQVLTEFYDPPEPAKAAELQATGLIDEHVDFGAMQIARDGRAFSVGEATEGERVVPVAKQWGVLEDRTFLVEEVPFAAVEEQIEALERRRQGASLRRDRAGQGESLLAALGSVLPKGGVAARLPAGSKRMTRVEHAMSSADPQREAVRVALGPQGSSLGPRRAFVLDYTILSSQTNFTFACNTNYYISGLVNLSGVTTIEGGTVIKYTNHTSAKISLSGPLICKTEAYRPAILTSKNDNTVGETISGSTGSPTNASGGTYLYSSVSNPTNALSGLRLSYAGTGLSFDGLTNGVWHSQFVRCNQGIDSYNQREVRLYNVLMAVSSNCIVNSTNIRGEHLTVDVCSNLVSATSASLALTNSILTGVLATGVGSPTYEQVVSASSGSGIYQAVGAASYYLADSSTNRNAGTTNLTATLLNDLKLRTTYPPLLISANITANTVLSPQAMRDTDLPDLGYHYDPLDWVASGRSVSANLTLSNGVALGTYGALSGYGLGLNSGSLVSEGMPTRLNWIVRYNTVQEQSTTNWSTTSVAPSVKVLTTSPTASVRFTGWSMPGGVGNHFSYEVSSSSMVAAFSHCRFGGGEFMVYPGSVGLTNCLWERVYATLRHDDDGAEAYLFNNLFYGGTVYYRYRGDSPVLLAYDNLFDNTTITKGSSSELFTHDYNAYVTNKSRLSPNGAHDVILTNSPTYLTSFLGRYYYPTDDGMLSTLLDAGSRTAPNATLYHFTTTTDQTKEGTSTVDIGFHYVATDEYGVPLDYDGDGVPDYWEDSNGDGDLDSGETDWTSASDLGLKVIITEPKTNSILP